MPTALPVSEMPDSYHEFIHNLKQSIREQRLDVVFRADVFAGQPCLTPNNMMDRGDGIYQVGIEEEWDFTDFSNQKIIPELFDQRILGQLNKFQRINQIAIKGITESGTTATDIFLYLESINLSKSDPTAILQFEVKMASGVPKKKNRIVKFGDNLYDRSSGLEEYKNTLSSSRLTGAMILLNF